MPNWCSSTITLSFATPEHLDSFLSQAHIDKDTGLYLSNEDMTDLFDKPPSPSPSSLVPPYPSPISPDSIPHTLNFYYSLMGKAPLPSLDLILDSNPSPLSSLVFTDVLTSEPFIRKIKGSDDCLFVSDTSYLPLSPDVNYYSYLGPDALSLIQHDLALLNS